MKRTRILESEVRAGVPLPWDAWSGPGLLLLRAGERFTSEQQMRNLLARGLYRHEPNADVAVSGRAASEPGARIEAIEAELLQSLRRIADGGAADGLASCESLANRIMELAEDEPDFALGSVALDIASPYTQVHPLMTGLIVALCGKRCGFDEADRRRAIMATLFGNVGMLDLQDELAARAGPLQEPERQRVRMHPEVGCSLLQAAGWQDPELLAIVAQHHERLDGSGYPRGLRGEAIHRNARLVALADIYAAMVLPRRYRRGIRGHEAVRNIFLERGRQVDDDLAQAFVREMGLYPPGTFVRLRDGQTGVVIRRASGNAAAPVVSCLSSPDGRHYEAPILRHTSERPSLAVEAVLDTPDPLPFPLARLWGATPL